jgi:hypothetical protein
MAAEQETDPRLRWLKPLVIGLSLLFVAMLLAVIVAMVTGVPQRSADAAKPGLPSAKLMEQSLNLPRNSRVADVFASGERIIIRVRLADGTERLYALHGQTLSPIGMLTVQVER